MIFLKTSLVVAGLFWTLAVQATPKADAPVHLRGELWQGGHFDLQNERGHPVLVHYFATWCSACQKEMPVLEHEVETTAGLKLVLLSPEKARHSRELNSFLKKHPFPLLLTDQVRENDLEEPASLPTTFLIDSQGRRVKVFEPSKTPLQPNALRQALSGAL